MPRHPRPSRSRPFPLSSALSTAPRLARRAFLGVLAASPLASLAPGRAAAQAIPPAAAPMPDWDVPGGHFYTQAAPGVAADGGYAVVDGDGVRFWRDYQRFGGPAQLGYPVSDRYEADGVIYQATQAALLAWDAEAEKTQVFPIFAALAELGRDEWLETRGIPRTSAYLLEDPSIDEAVRVDWLSHAQLRAAYLAAGGFGGSASGDETAGAGARYGLPMGAPERFGPFLAQRFDKAVLQLWLDDVAGQPAAGTVSLVQVGDLLKALELIPAAAQAPQAPPAPRPVIEPPKPTMAVAAASQATGAAITQGKYVSVSVGRQWWYAYEDGQVLNSGPVTTGRPELYTPIGRYSVLSKHSPFTFVSPWPPGSPYWYETATSRYALRITGNGIYLHDAPWRPYYGPGTNVPHTDPDGVWRTGSHGCINMPFQAAAWLYGWAPAGTPVDVTA